MHLYYNRLHQARKKKIFGGEWFWMKYPLLMGKLMCVSKRVTPKKYLFFFSHNNLANNLYLLEHNVLKDFNFTTLTNNDKWKNATNLYGSHTDLDRLKLGKVHGQVSKEMCFVCKTYAIYFNVSTSSGQHMWTVTQIIKIPLQEHLNKLML